MFKSFAAVAALTFAAAPALAVTNIPFTFDLNGTGTAGGGSSYGNYRTYQMSSGSGANKVTVNLKVSAWSWNGATVTNAFLGNNTASNGGLYDINRNEGSGANNTHTIDNQSGVDFLLFQFDRNVELTNVVANAFAVSGAKYPDNDLTIGRSVSISNSWNANTKTFGAAPAGLNGMAVGDLSDLFQAQRNINSSLTSNGSLDANRVLNPGGPSNTITGKVWMISASLVNSDMRIDGFKLDQLKIQTNTSMGVLGPVPEPATWGLMIAGFGTIGAAARRRRSTAAATA